MKYRLSNPFDANKFKNKVEVFLKREDYVELRSIRKRTLKQNNYMFVICGILAMETGCSIEFIKQEVFKRRVNPDLFVVEKDDPILGHIQTLRSSRDLNKEEMSKAIDRYLKFCSELGIYIPSPEDEALIEEAEYELSRLDRWL